MAPTRYLLLALLGVLPIGLRAQQLSTNASGGQLTTSPGKTPADQPAQYVGGTSRLLQDLQHAVRYPAEALRAQVSGTVLVSFVVEANGQVGAAHIVKSPSPLLNDAVLQAVKSLGAFTPGMKNGQPTRTTINCPLSFHIQPSTGPQRVPPQPVSPVPRGAVQPLAASPEGNQVVEKLVSLRDSVYEPTRKTSTIYQHYFTYDRWGRPETHTYNYQFEGQLLHSEMRRYTYRPDGQLASEGNDKVKYELQYNSAGHLRRITYAVRQPQQSWQMLTETLLTEQAAQPDGRRQVAVAVRTQGKDSLQLAYRLDYTLSADQAVEKSVSYTFATKKYLRPVVITFSHDTKVNPFQGLFSEHWYQDALERGGPHNILSKRQANGQAFVDKAYTYNDAGYPTRCVFTVRNVQPQSPRVQTFAYAKIVVPTAAPTDSLSSLVIYPNPASTTTTIKAPGIGPGQATLRILHATSGQVYRHVTYQVANTLRETLSVAGLEKGTYLVEITSAGTVVKGRLQVVE